MKDFSEEFNIISNELLALKNEYKKSLENLVTVAYNVNLSFDLELYDFGDGNVGRSDKMALVLFDVGADNPLVSVEYNINNLNNVEIRDVPYFDSGSGKIGRLIYVIDHNSSDINKLVNGESVQLNYTITLNSTTAMEYDVSYNDWWVN